MKKLYSYKKDIKKMLKKLGMSERQFHCAMEKDEIHVLAMHPLLKIPLPYRVKKVREDGVCEGYFING